jgi:hypothetical protein
MSGISSRLDVRFQSVTGTSFGGCVAATPGRVRARRPAEEAERITDYTPIRLKSAFTLRLSPDEGESDYRWPSRNLLISDCAI